MLLCLGVIGDCDHKEVVFILLQGLGIHTLPYLPYGSRGCIVFLELYDECWNIWFIGYEGNIGISLPCRKLVHYGVKGLGIVLGQVDYRSKRTFIVVLQDTAGLPMSLGYFQSYCFLVTIPRSFQ